MPADPRDVWKHLALTARTALAMRALPAWRLPQVMADIALLRLRHDIQLDEYTDYLFWENRAEKLKHHFTFRDHDQFNRQMNELKLTYVLADKRVLLRRMGTELGRQYWELDKVSPETFHSILADRDRLIVKPPRLGDGRGIRVIPGRLDRAASDRLYDDLIAQGCILLEEYITQHPALDRLYPEAVSVVKIHTFGCQGDCRIVLYPMLIVGSQGGTISNHHPIAIGIRRETAGLEALSVSGLSAHPDTAAPSPAFPCPSMSRPRRWRCSWRGACRRCTTPAGTSR